MNNEEIIHLYNQTFNAWNLVLMLSSWVALKMTREVFPELFRKRAAEDPFWTKLPRRMMPLYPIWICSFCYVVLPGPWIDPTLSVWQKLMLGTLCGFMAGHSHAIVARMLPEPLRALLMDGKADRHSDTPAAPSGAPTPPQKP